MGSGDTGVIEKLKEEIDEKIKEPSMYRVLLHNDDYTTMDFVVEVLVFIFHKTHEEANQIMLNVHEKGVGVCGVYTFEIAETKVETVHRLAQENEFPLKCSMEGV
jgi:ATP-dependent Clp protease adaptor protein ClpS